MQAGGRLSKRFWKLEMFLAAACSIGVTTRMIADETYLLWTSGERTSAVVLEVEERGGDRVDYWVRVGDRGVWKFDDTTDLRHGQEVDVLFDPDDHGSAGLVKTVGATFYFALAVAALPFVWLLLGGLRHLYVVHLRRDRAPTRRRDVPAF